MATQAATARNRDRRLLPRLPAVRVSLRVWLVVTLAIGVSLGMFTRRAKRQQWAVAWIESHGGEVWYEYDLERVPSADRFEFQQTLNRYIGNHSTDWNPVPGKWWISPGRDFEWSVQVVVLNNVGVRDVERLAHLPDLRGLSIIREELVTDVSPLAGLTRLEELHLVDCPVADLAPLSRLKNLKKLHLRYAEATDLSPLAQLSNLRELYIERSRDLDYAPLARLRQLDLLFLEYGTPELLARLRESLPGCRVSSQDEDPINVSEEVLPTFRPPGRWIPQYGT